MPNITIFVLASPLARPGEARCAQRKFSLCQTLIGGIRARSNFQCAARPKNLHFMHITLHHSHAIGNPTKKQDTLPWCPFAEHPTVLTKTTNLGDVF